MESLIFLLETPIGQFLLMLIVWTIFSVIAKIFNTKERLGLTIYPLILIYESDRFNNFIEKRAKHKPALWEYYARISGPITIILIFVSLAYFAINLFLLINNTMFVTETGVGAGTPVVPIIPFITIPINLFLALLIGSALAIIPHELAHGIVAVREGVPIKSSGIYIIGGVILGGFVKLDDEVERILEDMLSAKQTESEIIGENLPNFSRKIYRIASAGLLINLVLFGSLLAFTSTTFKKDGVIIVNVIDDGPASKAGLKRDDVIKQLDGYVIKDLQDLRNALSVLKPNETVIVRTDRGFFTVTLGSHPDNKSKAYLGVMLWDFYNFTLLKLDKHVVINLYIVLTISYLLQITVVFLNALPLYVTDGSKVLLFYMLSKKFKIESAMKVFNMANLIGLSILFGNLAISLGLFI